MNSTPTPMAIHASFARSMGITAISVAVLIALFHWSNLNKAEGELIASDTAFIQMAEEALQREFRVTIAELSELAGSPDLARLLETGLDKDRLAFEAFMANMMRASPSFGQLRFISDTGMELVRVNSVAGRPAAVPAEQLQNKAEREYFEQGIGLDPGRVYVSALDLNVEHGSIERPLKPMLRFATPVDDVHGVRRGILLINLMAQSVLDRVAGLKGNRGTVHMLNSDGYWLYGPDPELAWGFMIPPGASFAKTYPKAWEAISSTPSGEIQTDSGLITFSRIRPMLSCALDPRADEPIDHHDSDSVYSWELLTMVPRSDQRAMLIGVLPAAALQFLLIMTLLGPGCWLFATARQKQLLALADLVRSERRFASLTESVPDAILTVDDREKVVAWNRAADELFALEGRDIKGMPISWLVRNTEPRGMQKLLSMAPGETREMLGLHHSGEDFPIELAVGRWEENGMCFTSLIARDVTKRHIAQRKEAKLRSELDQARKLEAVGQLAAGIAHEINTPTQFVGDNTRFIKEAFEDLSGLFEFLRSVTGDLEATGSPEIARELRAALERADVEFLEQEIPKALEQSVCGLERVSKIVRAMREFAHPGQEAKSTVDLNRCIESTVTVATNEWKYACELHLDLDESLARVCCHPGEINQAILNMVVNASHAVSERIGSLPTHKGNIWISTCAVGDVAEIRIRDDGAGIPEDIRKRIFDPFFTTKDVGKGTGQGLALAHDVIARRHGGSLEFETELGAGTVFIVRIPFEAVTEDSPESEAHA